MPALNPEQRMVPLVDRGSASRRSEDSSLDDNPTATSATNTNPPHPGAAPGAADIPLPTHVQPRGMSPGDNVYYWHIDARIASAPEALGPASDDHPIEGPDWKERQILGFVFCDDDWQQMLRDAAKWGDEFKSRDVEGIFVRGARIAPGTDGHSSRTGGEKRDEEPRRPDAGTVAPTTDGHSSRRAGEKPDEESGRTDAGTVAQTTTASAVLA